MRVLASVIAASTVATAVDATKGCFVKTTFQKSTDDTATAWADVDRVEHLIHKDAKCTDSKKFSAATGLKKKALSDSTAADYYKLEYFKATGGSKKDGGSEVAGTYWLKAFLTANNAAGTLANGTGCCKLKKADDKTAGYCGLTDDLDAAGVKGVQYKIHADGGYEKEYYSDASCTKKLSSTVISGCQPINRYHADCEGTDATHKVSDKCIAADGQAGTDYSWRQDDFETTAQKTTRQTAFAKRFSDGMVAAGGTASDFDSFTKVHAKCQPGTQFAAELTGESCGPTCGCIVEDFLSECIENKKPNLFADLYERKHDYAITQRYKWTNKDGKCSGKFKKDDKSATTALAATANRNDAFKCSVAETPSGAISTRSAVAAVVAGALALLF